MLGIRPRDNRRVAERGIYFANGIYQTPRRLWYEPDAPPEEKKEVIVDPVDPIDDDEDETFDLEGVNRVEPAIDNVPYVSTPYVSVSEELPSSNVAGYSIADTIKLREAVLVSLGGAGAALVLLVVIAAVMLARRRKPGPTPVQSPPVLVYPPHDISAPSFLTSEVNFSLPSMRSCSMGELRDVEAGMMGRGSGGVLSPPSPAALRSNSFTNTYDLGVLDPALYKPDCLDHDVLFPEGHVGRVWFSLKYNSSSERLQVHILKAKHLPSRTPASAHACDPYIKIQLIPDERRILQTKQKKKTSNPCFDETFVYQVPAQSLESQVLKLSLMDGGRVGKDKQLIGHILLPLNDLEGSAEDEEPQLYKMDVEKEVPEPTSDLGEILVALLYNENLHRLTVTVIEARRLKLDVFAGSCRRDIAVRVTQARACRGVRSRRTMPTDVQDDGSADISECFHFRLRPDELHTTSVTLHVLMPQHACKDRVIGKFVLGSYMFARGRALQHWNTALAQPMEQVKNWHPLTN